VSLLSLKVWVMRLFFLVISSSLLLTANRKVEAPALPLRQ